MFRRSSPEHGASPAMLARGWQIRVDADIRNSCFTAEGVHGDVDPVISLNQRNEIVRRKAEIRKYPERMTNKPSPYSIGDIVQFKRPSHEIRKGFSPYSRPMKIISKIGKWDFRLEDNSIWNARNLRRYRPALRNFPMLTIEEDERQGLLFPCELRRSNRRNKGIPPHRFHF